MTTIEQQAMWVRRDSVGMAMEDIPAAFFAKFPDASEADLGRAIQAGAAGARADAAALFAEADALEAEVAERNAAATAFLNRIQAAADRLDLTPEDVARDVLDHPGLIDDVELGLIQPSEHDLPVLDKLLGRYVENGGAIDGFDGSTFFIDLQVLAVIDAYDEELKAARAEKPGAGMANVLAFPSGKPGGRTAQVVYNEMRTLSHELQEITGNPVSFTCAGAIDPTPEPKGAA